MQKKIVLAASFILMAAVLAIAPSATNTTKAENCTIYQDPVFNPFPVTFGSTAGTGCTDFPLVAARPLSSTPADYTLNMNANTGDTFYVRIYVHNGAAQGLDPNHTTMNNIVANTSIVDNNGGASHNINVTLSAGATNDGFVPQSLSSNSNSATTLTINTPSGDTLQIVPGSGSIYDFNGNQLQSGLTLGGATQLGSQQACFDFSRQILFQVKVVGTIVTPPPVQSTVSATVNSSTFCVYSKDEQPNDTASWTVTGSSNLAGDEILWSSTKNGVDTGEDNDYYGQNLNSSSQWSGQSNAPWNVSEIGSWTKTAKIFANGQILATSAPIYFTVKDCSTTIIIPPPPVYTVSATSNSSSYCVYSNGQQANDTASWTVTGSSNLAGDDVVWSSTKNGVSTGESNDYYNQNLNSAGFWSGQSNAPWNVSEIGSWTKTASIFANGQILATAAPIYFTVKDCATPPPVYNPVICSPHAQSAQTGGTVYFTASAGNGTYTWSGSNLSQTSGGSTSAVYNTAGTYTVNVTDGKSSDSCSVTVTAPPPVYNTVVCSPHSQSAQTGKTVNFAASAGNGSYSWFGNGLTQINGSSNSAIYYTAGTYSVSVTDGQSTDTCNVTVTAIPPVNQPVQCTPANQTINAGDSASFSATGGNGSYSWISTSGSNGSGSTFNATFNQSGSATVTSNGQSATCAVAVSQPIQVSTYTATASATASASASASCSNGTSATASASASASATATSSISQQDAQNKAQAQAQQQAQAQAQANAQAQATVSCPALTPTAQNFVVNVTNFCVGSAASYQFTGTANLAGQNISGTTVFTPVNGSAQTINNGVVGAMTSKGNLSTATLTGHVWQLSDIGNYARTFSIGSAQNQTATFDVVNCSPIIPPAQLVCNPNSTQTANVQQNVNFNAAGGSGNYTWSAPSSNIASGNGSNFTTSYYSNGNYTVTVNDGTNTASCNVAINTPVQPQTLLCTPPSQTANENQTVYFAAIGGNGQYTWSAPGSSQQYSSGNNNFTTTYYNSGYQTVTVQSGGQTASCNVQIINTVPQQLICSPPNQTAYAGQSVWFSVYGGNGQYTWSAPSASGQQYGSGSSFSTSFNNIGNQTVTVTSNNGQTASCYAQILQQYTPPPYIPPFPPLPTNASITLSKSAINNTKGGDATQTVASPGDTITYTLNAYNGGNTAANNFVVSDDLSQVMPYATIINYGNGSMNGNVITFPAQSIQPGGTVTATFQVRVNNTLANNLTYTMTNTYGNTITIRINTPQILGAFTAPTTGANTDAVAFGGLLMAGFGIYKKRTFLKKLILA